MRQHAFLPAIALFVLGIGAGTAAWAGGGHHHGNAHVGVYLAPSFGWGWYGPGPYYPYYAYPYSYSYAYPYPPLATVPSGPTNYIEREPAAGVPAPAASNTWYYCHNPEGYYPYVQQCSGEWQAVPAQPPQR